MSQTIVQLRVYKGDRILRDENGKIATENNLVKLEYGTKSYSNFIKNMRALGYGMVKVEKVIKGKKELEIKPFNDEIQAIFNPKEEKHLTPEQKEIAELKARLGQLTGGQKPNKKEVDETENEDIELVRAEYEKGEKFIYPEHWMVRNWKFKDNQEEEATLCNAMATVAEKNGMTSNDLMHLFPAALRMLKSGGSWS